ncbi:MAG: thioredoxin [Deltaproteobacteria bacterium]|nr:thioredoxin [Deltaproteobacteria bacterium]
MNRKGRSQMSTTNLTFKQLDETLEKNDIVLIDFFADWCGPCKTFAPVFEEASEKHQDIKFAKCNTEQEQQLAAAFGVRSIPTLAVFREKILLFLQPGALPKSALDELVTQVRGLDMDEVRKKEKDASEGKN